jgi:uncharacterized membrane protein YfcA
MFDWPVALAILGLVAFAAAIQAHSGFGFALFLVPFSTALIGTKETVLLAAMLALVMNALQSFRLRSFVQRRTASVLAVGSFAGMPAGVAVLLLANSSVLKAGTALAVLTATALLATGARLPPGNARRDLAAGLVSGVLNTSTGISGPPVALYLQGRRLPASEFRGTIAAFFFVTSVGALALLAVIAGIEAKVVTVSLLSLPFLFAGSTAGNVLFARTSEAHFRRMVLAVLALSGLTALGLSLGELLR